MTNPIKSSEKPSPLASVEEVSSPSKDESLQERVTVVSTRALTPSSPSISGQRRARSSDGVSTDDSTPPKRTRFNSTSATTAEKGKSPSSAFETPSPVTLAPAPPRPSTRQREELLEKLVERLKKVADSFEEELPVIAPAPADKIREVQRQKGVSLNGNFYRLPSDQLVAVLQQPNPQTPSCGVGCALMIAFDRVEKTNDIVQCDDIWNWYQSGKSLRAINIQDMMRNLNIQATICRLTTDASSMPPEGQGSSNDEYKFINDPRCALDVVEEKIRTTNHPVILAITHPVIQGHWIIVDQIHEFQAWVRDPFTGKAYSVAKEKLSSWCIEKFHTQFMIFFP